MLTPLAWYDLFFNLCLCSCIIFTIIYIQDEFYRLKDEFYRLSRNASVGVDGYVLAYSISSKSSFDKLKSINNVLFNMLGDPPAIPRVLVGTMLDLREQRYHEKTNELICRLIIVCIDLLVDDCSLY